MSPDIGMNMTYDPELNEYDLEVGSVIEARFADYRCNWEVIGLYGHGLDVRGVSGPTPYIRGYDTFWGWSELHIYRHPKLVGRMVEKPFLWFWKRKVFVPVEKPNPKVWKSVPLF